jgi:hypothetical protein
MYLALSVVKTISAMTAANITQSHRLGKRFVTMTAADYQRENQLLPHNFTIAFPRFEMFQSIRSSNS